MKINWINDFEKILKGEIVIKYSQSLKRILINKNILKYECYECNLKEWNNKPISLELDHIDGDNWNNKLENLRFLCPNCHSQTPTYKGKKRNQYKNSVINNENEIIDLYKKGNKISQILKTLNLNVGGNYLLIYRMLEKNNIPIINIKKKVKTKKEIEILNIENKIQNKKEILEIISKSNIDFSKKGWGKEVSKLIGFTPSYSLKFVKKYFPDIAKNAWQHCDNKNLIN